ncbi:UNVERIFIED_CONTAM: hypothetical protein HDU68_008671 [Siphonaria sp. JEL0065]|nr:hypothetical protein HDU68_008671 [Siphonaria sp. JEL0065]
MAIVCPASYNGTVGDADWLNYITCGFPLTPSINSAWPPNGCPNPALPPAVSTWPSANATSFPATIDSGYGPKLTTDQVYAILSLVWVAENSVSNYDGVIPWFNAYPYIQNIGDGRGYTTNIVGFCSGTGDLLDMLTNLQKLEPCNPLLEYVPDIAALSAAESGNLTGLSGFAELVVQQGGGPTGTGPINPNYVEATWQTLMKPGSASGYWGNAMELSRKYHLSLPISKGQLFDISLNAGTDIAVALAKNVSVKAPTRHQSGGEQEVKWLLALQKAWIKYIIATPDIDDGQTDRGILWQHLANPKNKTLNTYGQIGALNKKPKLHLELPLSVNCYNHTLTIRAPKKK